LVSVGRLVGAAVVVVGALGVVRGVEGADVVGAVVGGAVVGGTVDEEVVGAPVGGPVGSDGAHPPVIRASAAKATRTMACRAAVRAVEVPWSTARCALRLPP
jgi:hypothetical protein